MADLVGDIEGALGRYRLGPPSHRARGLFKHEGEHGDVFGNLVYIAIRICHAGPHSIKDEGEAKASAGYPYDEVHRTVAEGVISPSAV